MKTLFLDFASHAKSFAVVDGETVDLQHLSDKTDEQTLLPMIEAMIPLREIDRIVATTGPGGFMSLRVGLTVANTIAWSLKVPIAGVHLSDLWKARVSPLPSGEGSGVRVLWVHSTKKELLFVRGLGALTKKYPEPVLLSLDEAKRLPKETRYAGELIPEQVAALGWTKQEDARPLEAVLPEITERLTYEKPPLLPWYGREP